MSKILHILLTVNIFFLASKPSWQQKQSCKLDTSYKYASSKTDYNLMANMTNFKDYEMKKYTIVGLWHLSRHGGRYPDTEDIITINEALPKLRDMILNSNNSFICDEDKLLLKNWKSPMVPENDNNLTPNGRLHMRMLGSRMRKRLSALVKPVEKKNQLKYQTIQTTNILRTKQSAEEYMNGFFSKNYPKPQISFVSDGEDFLLKFPDYCNKYKIQVNKNSSACPENSNFELKSIDLANAKNTFRSRINLKSSNNESDLEILFESALKMCQYQYLIDGSNSIWCKFFDTNILKTIEYQEDIKYNCKYGYRHSISQLMTCDIFFHLLNTMKSIQNAYETNESSLKTLSKINVLFAHSSTMLPVYSVLGLGENPNNFDYDNIEIENENRSYRASKLDPMNNNIAFVLYKAKKSKSTNVDSFKIRVFKDETLVKIKGCNSYDCELKDFIQYFTNFRSVCQSSKTACAL